MAGQQQRSQSPYGRRPSGKDPAERGREQHEEQQRLKAEAAARREAAKTAGPDAKPGRG